MTEAAPRVRTAAPEDAAALGRLHVRAWQATYRGVMPQDFLDGLDPAEFGDRWARSFVRSRPGASRLVVCADPGDPVGFALVGPVHDSDTSGPGLGELYAINLDPDAWGHGLGRELLAAATAELARLGFSEMVLWVATANSRARRFYEAAGWSADGGERTDDSLGPAIDEVRYCRSVLPRPDRGGS